MSEDLVTQLRIDADEIEHCGGGNEAGRMRQAADEIERLKKSRSSDRQEWIDHMRTIGPMLQQAKEEGVLDTVIDANIWPLPKCAITEEDVQKSVEIARRIRPEIETEQAARGRKP